MLTRFLGVLEHHHTLAGWYQALFAAVGLIGVVVTLRQGNAAAAMAKRGARPWILAPKVTITSDAANSLQNADLAFTIWNAGGRLAILKKIAFNIHLVRLGETHRFQVPEGFGSAAGVIGPQQEIKSGFIRLRPDQIPLFQRGDGDLWAFIRVEYEDTEEPGTLYVTEACGRVRFLHFNEAGNSVVSFVPTGAQNSNS